MFGRISDIRILALAFVLATSPAWAQRSLITVHVQKAGVFSGFGHNHTITAPIAQAIIAEKKPNAEIVVLTKQMKVVDTEVSDSDRAKIQSTMLGPEVLNAQKYPEIRFKSLRIEQISPQHYHVTGTLTLHGVSKEITLEVSGGDHYQGTVKLNQTDFGIKPVSVAGGTIKVKDQLELAFDLYPGEFANGNRR